MILCKHALYYEMYDIQLVEIFNKLVYQELHCRLCHLKLRASIFDDSSQITFSIAMSTFKSYDLNIINHSRTSRTHLLLELRNSLECRSKYFCYIEDSL